MFGVSGRAGEFGEVVRGADQRPLGLHFFEAAQKELPEPSCLFDLTEDRLDDLLAQPVTAAPSHPLQLVPHGLGQRSREMSFTLGRVLGAPGRKVSPDTARGQGSEVGLAAVSCIGGDLFGTPAAKMVFGGVDQRLTMMRSTGCVLGQVTVQGVCAKSLHTCAWAV